MSWATPSRMVRGGIIPTCRFDLHWLVARFLPQKWVCLMWRLQHYSRIRYVLMSWRWLKQLFRCWSSLWIRIMSGRFQASMIGFGSSCKRSELWEGQDKLAPSLHHGCTGVVLTLRLLQYMIILAQMCVKHGRHSKPKGAWKDMCKAMVLHVWGAIYARLNWLKLTEQACMHICACCYSKAALNTLVPTSQVVLGLF